MEVPEKFGQITRPGRRKLFQLLQSISKSSDLSPDDVLAQSKVSPGLPSQRPPQPNRTIATSEPHYTPQEDKSSDVTVLPREVYLEWQQSLQTQLDKALAELRDVKAENKHLTDENQSQQRSISQLRTSLDEAKQAQENSSAQIKNQLRVATTSLTILNKEKKGWQDKLDSMQHKLSIAERQVRCLDHLTRYKFESRQEAAYGQLERRGPFASTPASTDVIKCCSCRLSLRCSWFIGVPQ